MAVKLRLKRMGRRHRPFFRICAMDTRAPRDGKAIEELGYYDPMVSETDARAILKRDRVDYWLSVGAQPTEKVGVLIKKYGTDGTHLEQQQVALEKLGAKSTFVPAAVKLPEPEVQEEAPAEEAAADTTVEATEASTPAEAEAETPTESAEEKSE